MPALYEIVSELQFLIDLADEAPLTDEQLATLDNLEMSLADKIDAVCKAVRSLETSAAVATEEAERLQKLATSRRNTAERLKAYLKRMMESIRMKRHESDVFKVRIQANPPSAKVTDESKVADEFKRTETVVQVKIDKVAAIAYWKENGLNPDGFEVSQSTRLVIA